MNTNSINTSLIKDEKILMILTLILVATLSSYTQKTDYKTLKIGDKAPTLVHIHKWMKVRPVPEFEKRKVYLVDVTLIACPDSVAIIPQLKQIADKYLGKVEVIAVYVARNEMHDSQQTRLRLRSG